jgi:hypothetical protein
MSCGCNQKPCVCPPQRPCTKCDRYQKGMQNVWVSRASSGTGLVGPDAEEDVPGICLLDTMTRAQIIYVLERDEKARADLLVVTSCPELLHLARTVPRLPVVEETDAEQALLNRPNEPAQNPFYAIFRGQPPYAQ